MANIPKKGLDYFPFEVGVFEDDKIIDLIAERKYTGFVVWLKILALIYKDKGYYYRWGEREPGRLAMKMGCGATSELVSKAVETCVEVGLFDKSLYEGHGILSGKGIQRRYADAVKERKYKEVIAEFWLLDEKESAGFSKRAYPGFSENKTAVNADKTEINEDKTEINPQSKEKEKKRESKEEEREIIRRRWNALGVDNIEELSGAQILKVDLLLSDYEIGVIEAGIAKAGASSFLRGKKKWKANFDWFIDGINFSKVLSGKYDDGDGAEAGAEAEAEGYKTFDLNDFSEKAFKAGMRYEKE